MNKFMNDIKTIYLAQGLCYGNYWGGGKGTYAAKRYKAASKEELKNQITKGIKDGSIDTGMGFESMIGAIMSIVTIRYFNLTIDGEELEFSNKQSETELFGELDDDEVEFLEEHFYGM